MVEVTQADRELLIELISFDSETIDAILAGNAFTWEVEQIARHRIAALEEAANVAAWQPIETAPFDQMILLHCPHTAPKTSVGCCAEDCGWLIVEYDMMGSNCKPTHWMPIPKGPTDDPA